MSENTASASWEQSPRAKYAEAVRDSLDIPVISVEAAGMRLGDDSLSEKYPGGYLSPRDFVGEQVFRMMRGDVYGPLTEEQEKSLELASAAISERFADRVGGVLSGTEQTDDKAVLGFARDIGGLVAAHAPGGQFAKLGGRPEAEQQALEQQYGSDAKFFLPPDGVQNHQALRVMELWSAANPNYMPAHTSARVMRNIAGYTGPIWNAITGRENRQVGQPLEDAKTLASPDGKFQYATNLYWRADPQSEAVDTQGYSGPDDPYRSSVFTKDGLPKYYKYDHPLGVGQFNELNQDFPLAKYKQNASEAVNNWATNLTSSGGWMEDAGARADIRSHINRTVPTIPAGVTEEQLLRIGRALEQYDSRLSGVNSSRFGPAFADAWNNGPGKFAGPMKRTYPSLFVSSLLDLPGEMITDLPNAVVNAAAPFASGTMGVVRGAMTGSLGNAAKAGGINFFNTLARTPLRFWDDMLEESVESGVIGAPLVGGNPIDFFTKGQDFNTLTGDKNPNDADYWQYRQGKEIDAYQGQHDAAKEWRRLNPAKPQQPASPYTRPLGGKPTMLQ